MASVKESVEYTVGMDNKEFVKGANENTKSMGNMSKGIGLGTKAILGIGTASVGAVAGMFKMADMSSDLNEAMNVITATMGDSADEIIKWSENSIRAMGISQTQALKTAGVYGSMGSSLGLTTAEASKMAMELTQLSADMGSFYNVSQEVAATGLKGIFTGETESLKQFGIMIDVATLEQYGYNKEMSASEKIMVRYQAVMDQTKNIQGDFARTSDGLANQTRILKEQFVQLFTVLGSKVEPVINRLVTVLNSGLASVISILNGETPQLSANFAVLGGVFQKIAIVVQSVLNVAMATFGVIIQSIKTVIIGLSPILIFLGTAFAKISQILASILVPILNVVQQALLLLQGAFLEISQVIVTNLGPILAKLILVWQQIAQALQPVIIAIGNLLIPVVNILTDAFKIFISVITPIIDFIVTIMGPVIVLLANIISTILTVAINALTVVLNALSPIFTLLAGLAQRLGQIIRGVLAVAFTALEAVVTVVSSALQGVSNIFNQVGAVAGTLANIIRDTLGKAFEIILVPIEAVSNAIETLIGWFNSAMTAVSDFFGGIQEGLSSIPFIGGLFGGSPVAPQGVGETNNYYNFQVQANDISTYRKAYRTGRAMVGSGGKTL